MGDAPLDRTVVLVTESPRGVLVAVVVVFVVVVVAIVAGDTVADGAVAEQAAIASAPAISAPPVRTRPPRAPHERRPGWVLTTDAASHVGGDPWSVRRLVSVGTWPTTRPFPTS